MAFAAAATIAPLSMVFGCGAIVHTLTYGCALLDKSLAFMGSTDDQRNMAPKGVLVRHPKDPLLPWHDSAELFRKCEDIVLSLTPRTLVILDALSTSTHPILWWPPNTGLLWWNYFGHRHRLRGWPHNQMVCLCGQLSSVHPRSVSPSSPVDGVVTTIVTPNYHLWVFFTSPS